MKQIFSLLSEWLKENRNMKKTKIAIENATKTLTDLFKLWLIYVSSDF